MRQSRAVAIAFVVILLRCGPAGGTPDAGSSDGEAADANDLSDAGTDGGAIVEYVLLYSWGTRGSGPGQFRGPHGIAVDGAGFVYVADTGNHRIQKFTQDGTFVTEWGGLGTAQGQFDHPHGLALDADRNLFVGETGNNRVQKFTSDGVFVVEWGVAGDGEGEFRHVHSVEVDPSGDVYVADRDRGDIQRFTNDGAFVLRWEGLQRPNGIGISRAGTVFVSETAGVVGRFELDGTLLGRFGSAGAAPGEFDFPRGVVVGPSGDVFLADRDNHRIQRVTPEGAPIVAWGSRGGAPGQLLGPYAVAVDRSGNVFVADSGNDRVQVFEETAR